MKSVTLAVAFLALVGCTEKVKDPKDWQRPFKSERVEVQWGAQGTKYVELTPWKEVTGDELTELHTLFRPTILAGALKCVVHIDGKLRAGGTEARVCLGCGELFVDSEQYVFGPREELRALMTKVLGARPPEPDLFPGL